LVVCYRSERMEILKDRNPSPVLSPFEMILCLKEDFLIHRIVGAASTKEAVTVGVNVP
jgi:hypothetical protein